VQANFEKKLKFFQFFSKFFWIGFIIPSLFKQMAPHSYLLIKNFFNEAVPCSIPVYVFIGQEPHRLSA
jgi:hypothetical protein